MILVTLSLTLCLPCSCAQQIPLPVCLQPLHAHPAAQHSTRALALQPLQQLLLPQGQTRLPQAAAQRNLFLLVSYL